MDVLLCFDNIINKDSITYEGFFSEIVDWWRFGKENQTTLILSVDRDCLFSNLFSIATLYWKDKDVKIVKNIKFGNIYKFVVSTKRSDKEIELGFLIMNLNTFDYRNIRGLRCENVIVDVDAKRLNKVKLPFNKDSIYQVLRPMMCMTESGFLTLMY